MAFKAKKDANNKRVFIRSSIFIVGVQKLVLRRQLRELKSIKSKYKSLAPILDERSKRIWAATEARNSEWGGVTLIHLATGIARNTIRHGISELKNGKFILSKKDCVCRSGGGRKLIVDEHPELLKALELLVDSGSRGLHH